MFKNDFIPKMKMISRFSAMQIGPENTILNLATIHKFGRLVFFFNLDSFVLKIFICTNSVKVVTRVDVKDLYSVH